MAPLRPGPARHLAAAAALVLLLPAGCGTYRERLPFAALSDHVAWAGPVGATDGPGVSPEEALPGVGFACSLAGVIERPADAAADSQHFEFRLHLAQPGLAPADRWTPLLAETCIEDDEGRQLPASAVFVAAPKGRKKGAPPGLAAAPADDGSVNDYLVECRIPGSYRFQGIGWAVVHWTLQREDGARVRVRSRFQH
jgi:hypothetical protein